MKFIKFMILAGAFNWGAVGLLRIDVIAWLFGDMSLITRIIYIIVLVCAVMFILKEKKDSNLMKKVNL